MESASNDERTPQKSRRKKALLALLSFHKKLEKACGTFEKADAWYGFLKKNVNPLLDMYEDDLPKDVVVRLRKATELTDTSKDAINQTCNVLKHDVMKVAKAKASTHAAGKWIMGTALVGVAAVSAGLIYLKQSAVAVTVSNRGCDDMTVTGSVSVKLPGISVPDRIPSGGSATFTVPPMNATVDATAPNVITFTTMGAHFSFDLDPGISITFDGKSLRGQRATLRLGDKLAHDVVITCR
ncbi:MAG TPA: hypothetical protein VJB96_01850 [Patescibacteria group bacterium]|nr:hypothetical protein [Patescibacteria group bacterium]